VKILTSLLYFLSSFFIFAGVALAFINVVARFVFNKGLEWAFELTSYFFIYSVFFATAYLFKKSEHIRVTLLLEKFSFLDKVADIISIIYLSIIAYFSYLYIFDPELGLKASKEISIDLNVPMWVIYLVLPISMVLSIIMTIDHLKGKH